MIDDINQSSNSRVNQSEYMKLFMQELTYQDPLKPVDNREFMAQMAQFSTLEAVQQSSEYLSALAGMTSVNQSLMMLGKHVKIVGSNDLGTVEKIKFPKNSAPVLIVNTRNGSLSKSVQEITEVEAS